MALQTGILSEVLADLRPTEKRTSLENPQTPLSFPAEWLLDIFNGGRTDSGIRVSELSAFGSSTFHACVDLISNAIAGLPTQIKERTIKNGRAFTRTAYEHDLYDLINYEPNPDMSWFTYMKATSCHFLAWGSSYTEIQRDAANGVVALWPRNPYNTRPHILGQAVNLPAEPWRPFPVSIPAGTMVYVTKDGADNTQTGNERIIPAEDMIAITGLTFDGRIGQGIVALARERIGMDLASGKFGAKYFANYAKPAGILTLPANMSPDQREKAKQTWQEAQGGENAHRIAALPPGFDFKQISHNPQEAQMNEMRKEIRTEICSVFHVPPHMVGDTAGSKATAEQTGTEFLSFTLNPWLTAIQQEFKRKLFPNPQGVGIGRKPSRNNFFLDFDTHEMLRATAADREKFYQTMFTTGAMSPNDIRELEGLNPREDEAGDRYYVPVNMQDAENPVVVPNPAQPEAPKQEAPAPKEQKQPEAKSFLGPVYSRVFRDAFGRVMSREKRDLQVFNKAFSPVMFAIADMLQQLRDPDFRGGSPLPGDLAKFVTDYIGGMHHRSSDWTLDRADELSNAELERAIAAVTEAVSRVKR